MITISNPSYMALRVEDWGGTLEGSVPSLGRCTSTPKLIRNSCVDLVCPTVKAVKLMC